MALGSVVVGATRKDLVVTITDANGNPVNLTGGSATLQGRSRDVTAVTINSACTLTDAAAGIVTKADLGSLVSQANLTSAAVKLATFKLRIKYVDNAAKVDFTDEFELIWAQDPLQPA